MVTLTRMTAKIEKKKIVYYQDPDGLIIDYGLIRDAVESLERTIDRLEKEATDHFWQNKKLTDSNLMLTEVSILARSFIEAEEDRAGELTDI